MDRDGQCQPLMSPVDVQLDCDERTMVQPDVAILCHNDRVRRKEGAGNQFPAGLLKMVPFEKGMVSYPCSVT